MQCYSMSLLICEEELSYNIRVSWWQLFVDKKNPHWSLQLLHAAMLQVRRGADILLRVLSSNNRGSRGTRASCRDPKSSLVCLFRRALQLLSLMLEQPVGSWLMNFSSESVSRVAM